MNGIINVLKPPGMTSHDVVSFLRKLLTKKSIGHGGTLDPAAAGVLPVFINKATKAIEFYEGDYKEYVTEMTLGVVTDTGDLLGNVLEVKKVDICISKVRQVVKQFLGNIEQVPPMYSAISHHGVKLYKLARKGITVERKPRTIEIESLDILNFDKNKVIFKVVCSKGTYIRTLCEDIGQKLGTGACLSCLVRTKSGSFYIGESYTLDEIEEKILNNDARKIMLPIDYGLGHMPILKISLAGNKLFKGNKINIDFKIGYYQIGDLLRMYDNSSFIGIGIIESKNQVSQMSTVRIIKSFI